MSKQEVEAGKVLNLLMDDVQCHVDLSRITKNPEDKGIIVDYWCPEINAVVEIHGIQHYQVSGFGARQDAAQNQFNRQTNRDEKLRRVCTLKGIELIEISYKEKDFTNLTKQVLGLL